MIFRMGLYFLFTLSWSVVSFAQGLHENDEGITEIVSVSSLSIGDVVRSAMALSPAQRVIRSRELNADALSRQSSSLFSDTPEISFNMQNDSLMTNQGLREWESSLDMPLWMPGQKSASKLKARMSGNEAAAYEKLSILQITGQVREMLWELKFAELTIEESRRNLKLTQAINDDIAKRINAGNLPRRDLILAQKEVMSQKMNLINAEAEYIHVVKEYISITGLSEKPEIIEEIAAHQNDSSASKLGGQNSPILELANARVNYRQAELKVSKNSWATAPRLSVGFKRERGTLFNRSINSLRLGISVPLGAGVHMTSKRASIALELAEAQRERELIKRELKLALHEAEHEIETCEIQLPLAKSLYALSKENLRLSQKAFDLGESNLMDLLKIQEQFFMSSNQNNQQIISCGRAIARHNQTLGVLLP